MSSPKYPVTITLFNENSCCLVRPLNLQKALQYAPRRTTPQISFLACRGSMQGSKKTGRLDLQNALRCRPQDGAHCFMLLRSRGSV